MNVVVWLRSLGLGKYEAVFRENEIDETVLPSLTEEHLKQLGVTALGHRVKLLDAIAALRRNESVKLDRRLRRRLPRPLLASADILVLHPHRHHDRAWFGQRLNARRCVGRIAVNLARRIDHYRAGFDA